MVVQNYQERVQTTFDCESKPSTLSENFREIFLHHFDWTIQHSLRMWSWSHRLPRASIGKRHYEYTRFYRIEEFIWCEKKSFDVSTAIVFLAHSHQHVEQCPRWGRVQTTVPAGTHCAHLQGKVCFIGNFLGYKSTHKTSTAPEVILVIKRLESHP